MPDTIAKDKLENALEEELETSSEDADKVAEPTGEAKPPTKVKVGDNEFDPDELAKLVAKGKLAADIEREQNIDIKELYPDYTRKSQLLKNPEKLKNYLSSQVDETFTQHGKGDPNDGGEIPDEVKTEIAKARKLGFLTQEDVDRIVEKAVNASTVRTKAEIKLENRLTELEEKYNGGEKAPIKIKFDREAILNHLIENYRGAKQVPDPEDVFKLMHLDDFQKQTAKPTPVVANPPVTEKAGSTGNRVPKGREVPSFSDEGTLRKYLEEEFTKDQVEV